MVDVTWDLARAGIGMACGVYLAGMLFFILLGAMTLGFSAIMLGIFRLGEVIKGAWCRRNRKKTPKQGDSKKKVHGLETSFPPRLKRRGFQPAEGVTEDVADMG